jgi:OmpR-family two-component system manganese-sensing response regulator
MAKLLLVDDDNSLRTQLVQLLKAEGHQVEDAACGADGLQMMQNFAYDLIVLDWSMPDMTGLDVCQKYRQGGGRALILFLTGNQEVQSKAAGLDSGGDDYLVKPFSVIELLARLRSLLRRPQTLIDNAPVVGDYRLDPKKRQLTAGAKVVSLSQLETRIVELLLASPGQIFTSKDLFKLAWSSESESSEQSVRVHVKAIRNKLAAAEIADFIKTHKGGGWYV